MVESAATGGTTDDGGSQHPRWPMVASAVVGDSTGDGRSQHPFAANELLQGDAC
jgi:hypothetical protein